MTTLFALVSGFGWHVGDLQRAAERADMKLHAVPFPQVSAVVGMEGPDFREKPSEREPSNRLPRVGAGGHDLTVADGILVRMMPPGSLEQVVFRMDALH